MKKQTSWKIKDYDEHHKYKIAFDVILEFIHQLPDDSFNNPEKYNFSTDDYTLKHFQRYVCKKLEDTKNK